MENKTKQGWYIKNKTKYVCEHKHTCTHTHTNIDQSKQAIMDISGRAKVFKK